MNTNLRKIVGLLKMTNEIRLTGGVSYNINTQELNPPFGYMVALPGHEEIHVTIDEETIRDYIIRHSLQFAEQNAFFGCWFDGKDYVLDVSEHYERKRDAVFKAIVHKQKAIWDCEKRDEIRIKLDKKKAVQRYLQTDPQAA